MFLLLAGREPFERMWNQSRPPVSVAGSDHNFDSLGERLTGRERR
jgi:hypothetical protein